MGTESVKSFDLVANQHMAAAEEELTKAVQHLHAAFDISDVSTNAELCWCELTVQKVLSSLKWAQGQGELQPCK